MTIFDDNIEDCCWTVQCRPHLLADLKVLTNGWLLDMFSVGKYPFKKTIINCLSRVINNRTESIIVNDRMEEIEYRTPLAIAQFVHLNIRLFIPLHECISKCFADR